MKRNNNRDPRRLMQMIAVLLLGASGSAAELFVAPNGNDTNPGTQDKPFGTVQAAQRAARKLAGREAVSVVFREGIYYLTEPLAFNPEDSGTKETPVVYQAFLKEKVVISGGVRLSDLKWMPYQNGILQTTVPADFATDQLFVNGERQILARYPNFDANIRILNGFSADAFSPQRVINWKDPVGGFIHAMHSAEWGGMHYVITGKDGDTKITYEGGWQNNRPSGMHRQQRFVENIFEELDAPAEWYLNTKTHLLYYYPPKGADLSNATIEGVHLKHLIEFHGTEQAPVRFVSIKGITFRHTLRTFMENKEPLVRSDWTTYRGGAIFYTGCEDCSLEDCTIDQVGGNAVFVNNYNRRVTVRGCHISKAGGNGVAFVGDRDAARVPRDWKDRSQTVANLDRTPGPKTNNYPADCLVDDCLIYLTGRVEKQTAPVQIELSQSITVRHCSIYDVPRAGINIGDGCWGGHVIEFCDIFDTVKETGDHGSFNSWGRDRFWGLDGLKLNDDQGWEANKGVVLLDAVKTTIMRNNRWRCDHGWDIDLDDGSSNYEIRNNLCLNGGIKNREGFNRVVENNIVINNGFHPHVWFKHSEDIVRHNIFCTDHYLPAGGMPAGAWGKELDNNLVHRAGVTTPVPAEAMSKQSKRDEHSIIADAFFVDPSIGDYRVKDGSPALKLGFVNFPMDQFGVQKPELKAIARTPEIPTFKTEGQTGKKAKSGKNSALINQVSLAWQAVVRDISGLGDRSAFGLPDESGVLLVNVPTESSAAQYGFLKDDVITACDGKPVRNVKELIESRDSAAGKKFTLSVIRKQNAVSIEVVNYLYAVRENAATAEFKTIQLAPPSDVIPAKVSSSGPPTHNDPVDTLTDGKVVGSYGPVFPNGSESGMYKLDLSAVKSIAQINTFSALKARSQQTFSLYASDAAIDPGWNVSDAKVFTPLIAIDTHRSPPGAFAATSIRRSDGKPIGSFRWLVWAVVSFNPESNQENTAFQELQVLPAGK